MYAHIILLSNPFIYFLALFSGISSVSYLVWLLISQNNAYKKDIGNPINWLIITYIPGIVITFLWTIELYTNINLFNYISSLYPSYDFLYDKINPYLILPLHLFLTGFYLFLSSLFLKFILNKIFPKFSLNLSNALGFLASITGTVLILFFGIVIGLYMETRDDPPSEFHIFNAHLKDVCSEEKYQKECPRTANDLRNFDPPHWDSMVKNSLVYYYFDDLGKGTLIVRSGNSILVSDSRFNGRYDFYYRKNFINKERTYPPQFPGQWHKAYLWGLF